jgi:hypothetical protein
MSQEKEWVPCSLWCAKLRGLKFSFMFAKKPGVASKIIMQMWMTASVSYGGLLPVFLAP